MRKIGTPTILIGVGTALFLTGVLAGSASAGWSWSFPTTPTSRVLIVSGFISCYVSTYLVRREGKRARRREEDFLNELKVIADDLTMLDKEDRLEDLCFLYDEEERKDILKRLESMPRGSRKLSVVLEQMDTDSD